MEARKQTQSNQIKPMQAMKPDFSAGGFDWPRCADPLASECGRWELLLPRCFLFATRTRNHWAAMFFSSRLLIVPALVAASIFAVDLARAADRVWHAETGFRDRKSVV